MLTREYRRDNGIVLSTRNLKETSKILLILTEHHGLKRCIYHMYGHIHELCMINMTWREYNENIKVIHSEPLISYASLMHDHIKLCAVSSIINLITSAFQENEDYGNLFHDFKNYLDILQKNMCIQSYIEMELAILTHAGYETNRNEEDISSTVDFRIIKRAMDQNLFMLRKHIEIKDYKLLVRKKFCEIIKKHCLMARDV